MTVQSDLEAFAALLRKWNAAQNLVSRETLDELWPRHIADSLQLAELLPAGARRVLDLGSGGGFPAIPVAIAARGRGFEFLLVESNAKKCAFLRTVARELSLPVEVATTRVEQLDSRETFDVITSRALAALPTLLELALRFVGPGTVLLFHKGRNFAEECLAASAKFDFDVVSHKSTTDAEGVILEIRHLRAKSAA